MGGIDTDNRTGATNHMGENMNSLLYRQDQIKPEFLPRGRKENTYHIALEKVGSGEISPRLGEGVLEGIVVSDGTEIEAMDNDYESIVRLYQGLSEGDARELHHLVGMANRRLC